MKEIYEFFQDEENFFIDTANGYNISFGSCKMVKQKIDLQLECNTK